MKNTINIGFGAAKSPEVLAEIVNRKRAYAHEIEVVPFFVGYIEATRDAIGNVRLIVTPICDISEVPEVLVPTVRSIEDRMYCMSDRGMWNGAGKT